MKGRGLIFLLLGVGLLLSVGPTLGWVDGTGTVEVSRSVVNRMEEFEYYSAMMGDGSLALGRGSDGASKAGIGDPARTISLSYSGDAPLVGLKQVESGSLFSGTKTSIMEAFSATEIEKEETTGIRSGGSQLVGTENKLSFNGTYVTSSNMHQLFAADISSHQKYSGKFEIENTISFGSLTDRRPSISLVVSPEETFAGVGEAVARNYEVVNTGTVPVQGLTLVDSRVGPLTLSKTSLNPGDSTSAVASFIVREEDLPGPLTDLVDVKGFDIEGNQAAASSAATVKLISPGLNLTIIPLQSCAAAGEVVTYIYEIENAGEFTISGLNVTDSISGGPIAINITLLPGENIALRADGGVIEKDLQGAVNNSVTVTGLNSAGETVGSSAVAVLLPC
jgi:uncharacterized repeat protein (TIGR01451 family)